MKIEDRWTLEILVNEEPLQEYVISDSVLGISASNALKSYVVEGSRKKFCGSATFVAVPSLGTCYSIKISPSTTSEIAARVFVDGISDGFFTGSRDSSHITKGFYNMDASKIYNFTFDKTEWVETIQTNITQNVEFGGFGAISVYFYKVSNIDKSLLEYSSNKDFEEIKVPESKKNIDVALTTKFSEGVEHYSSGPWEIITTENEPLAALHINYRSVDWFLIRGISEIQDSNTSILDIKKEGNNLENDTEVKISITTSIIQPAKKIEKRRLKYREILLILDSDDESIHEVMELD